MNFTDSGFQTRVCFVLKKKAWRVQNSVQCFKKKKRVSLKRFCYFHELHPLTEKRLFGPKLIWKSVSHAPKFFWMRAWENSKMSLSLIGFLTKLLGNPSKLFFSEHCTKKRIITELFFPFCFSQDCLILGISTSRKRLEFLNKAQNWGELLPFLLRKFDRIY